FGLASVPPAALRPLPTRRSSDLRKGDRAEPYDPNTMATRHELRTMACGQCHVEYYFKGDQKVVTYPWHKGLKVEQIEAYYDEVGDRKSTRLNSSHVKISYAVFCL